LGMTLLGLGEINPSEEAFSEVLTDDSEEVSSGVRGDAANNLALIYWKRGQYGKASEMLKTALGYRREGRDRFGTAATLMNLGIVEEHMGLYEQARESYLNAQKLMEQLEYAQGLVAVHTNIGNMEYKCRHYHKAQEHNTRALLLAKKTEDIRSEAIACENVALGYAALGDMKQAEAHFAKGLKLAEKLEDPERIASIRLGQIEIALEKATDGKSLEIPFQWLDEMRESEFAELVPRALRLTALAYERDGKTDRAFGKYQESLTSAEKMGNRFEAQESLLAMVEFCRKHRQTDTESYEQRLAAIG